MEEPKYNGGSSSKNNNYEPDELDDFMFDMTPPNVKPANTRGKSNQPLTPATVVSTTYISDNGQTKDAWFKDEEIMRRKLEKGAISQLKSKIAQMNK